MPTCLVPAPPLETLDFGTVRSAILTGYWNAVGNPTISIPMGLTSAGLPMGLQLSGRPFEEATVLRAADAFQLQTTHHLTEPAITQELLG
jgi:aspartyl-tRNA(Asn)/glutamyl-tRNA(Gln) amidotransferase subunit A